MNTNRFTDVAESNGWMDGWIGKRKGKKKKKKLTNAENATNRALDWHRFSLLDFLFRFIFIFSSGQQNEAADPTAAASSCQTTTNRRSESWKHPTLS